MSISVLDALRPAKKSALLVLTGLLGLLVGVWVHGKYYSDRSPVQPIEFSHKIHATDNEIPCQHCHIYADTRPVAGVPSVSKCIGCHASIPSVREQPEILKLALEEADRCVLRMRFGPRRSVKPERLLGVWLGLDEIWIEESFRFRRVEFYSETKSGRLIKP